MRRPIGYRKIYHLLQGEQWRVKRETVRRIRQHAGLKVSKKEQPRPPVGASTTTPSRAAHPHYVWRYAFAPDETTAGRRLQCLTVLDGYTREGLATSYARAITANEGVPVLQGLFVQRGAPVYVKSDHGPELMTHRVTTWLHVHHVDTHFIEPGSPWQPSHNESCNGVCRDGCLNLWLFTSVHEARRSIATWRQESNHERPHGALERLTPRAFVAQCGHPALAKVA